MIRTGSIAVTFPCPACGFVLEVHSVKKGEAYHHFVHCSDDGRYLLSAVEASTYTADLDAIADRIASCLGFPQAKARVTGSLWELGVQDFGRVYLLRGTTWPKQAAVLSNEIGLCLMLATSLERPAGLPVGLECIGLDQELEMKAGALVLDSNRIFERTRYGLKNRVSGPMVSPPLTQTQHCDIWSIGIPGNVFKKGRPLQKVWIKYKRPDKTAALPLSEILPLLLNYWSKKGQARRAPKDEGALMNLYSSKGYV